MDRWEIVINVCDQIFQHRNIKNKDFKQDMYIHIYIKSIEKFSGDISSDKFRNWASVVCKNQLINKRKTDKVYSFVDFRFFDTYSDYKLHKDILEHLEHKEELNRESLNDKIIFEQRLSKLNEAKKKLYKPYQRILDMKMKGLTIREISQIEGRPLPSTSEKYYKKIIPKIKANL